MIYITMCWRGKDWRGYENPHNYPLISFGEPGLGMLMFHGVGRDMADPVWTVETIGL